MEYGVIRGIIIPLELEFRSGNESSGCKEIALQDLYGVELLTWLRWSAPNPLQELPVLAVAFHPLERILQRTINLLLVLKGTQFSRLPDARESALKRFVESVTTNDPDEYSKMKFDIRDLDQIAGVKERTAQAVTHHALANDFYGAYRLWEGYKSALAGAMESGELKKKERALVKEESDRATGEVTFSWEHGKSNTWGKAIEEKLNQPHVKQYLTFAKQGFGSPQYPLMKDAGRVILKHVENGFEKGLLQNTRILFVDDEFDKGLAEVLLQILFKKSEFTYTKGNSEWVYSEVDDDKEWERLVCVKSADLAEHWLALWGEVDKEGVWNWEAQKQWQQEWGNQALVRYERDGIGKEEKLPTRINAIIDAKKHQKPNKNRNTVVLLDLRLEPGEQKEIYDPLKLKSVQLRSLIKANRDPAPVMMLTASRQAMSYVMIMEDAIKADGWLMKEGPDIAPDAGNSACAVHYLLNRFHRLAVRREWYREEMGWKQPWIDMYDEFRSNPDWEERLEQIHEAVTKCFSAIKQAGDEEFLTTSVKKWIDEQLGEIGDSEEKILARRLVIYGMLLLTGTIENGKFEENPSAFSLRMPNASKRAGEIKYPSDVLNFDNLCNGRYGALSDGMLLKEEYEWLLIQFPSDDYPEIHEYLKGVMKEKFSTAAEL